jgi:hypothetical protein
VNHHVRGLSLHPFRRLHPRRHPTMVAASHRCGRRCRTWGGCRGCPRGSRIGHTLIRRSSPDCPSGVGHKGHRLRVTGEKAAFWNRVSRVLRRYAVGPRPAR